MKLKLKLSREENERAEAALRQHDGKVQALARKHLREGVLLADLIQVGRLAVLRAIQKMDPTLGSGHSYVWETIKLAMLDFVRANHSTIRVPNYQFGRVWRPCYSLDSPTFYDGETTLAERVPAEEPESGFDDDEWTLLQGAIGQLTTREKQIIHAIFYQDLTIREIGKRLGFSFQNIQYFRNKALARLKKNGVLRELYEGRAA